MSRPATPEQKARAAERVAQFRARTREPESEPSYVAPLLAMLECQRETIAALREALIGVTQALHGVTKNDVTPSSDASHCVGGVGGGLSLSRLVSLSQEQIQKKQEGSLDTGTSTVESAYPRTASTEIDAEANGVTGRYAGVTEIGVTPSASITETDPPRWDPKHDARRAEQLRAIAAFEEQARESGSMPIQDPPGSTREDFDFSETGEERRQ